MTTDAISDAASQTLVPQACTLPTVERPQRLADFAALYASALRPPQRMTSTQLRMVLDPAAEQRARDLTTRESAYCSFFTFTFSQAADGLHLDVHVPLSYIDVLDAVARQAVAVQADMAAVARMQTCSSHRAQMGT